MMDDTYFFLIRDILLFCLGGATLLGLFYYKQFPNSFRIIVVYLTVTFLMEVMATWLSTLGVSNLFTIHFYTLFELIIFAFFFKPLLKRPVLFVRHYFLIIGTLVLLILANSLFVQSFDTINSYSETAENLVLIFLSILLFINLYLLDDLWLAPYRHPIVLVNSGLLLYLSGSLFIFMFGEYILQSSLDRQFILWNINVTLNLVFKILLLIAIFQVILISRKQGKESL